MPSPLAGKNIVLGVTGGIAAYKAVDLASKLVQLGADVHVAMTAAACQFVQPLSFQAITRNPVHTSVFEGWDGSAAGHVTLAAEADLVLVVPATANSIARMAAGMADDMLSAILLATQAPIVVAPAMEHHMWHHPATQANLETLRLRGVAVILPDSGRLASGATGDGRLSDPAVIIMAVRAALGRFGPLVGRRVVITAGGTHEPIDPVRFIGNGSSGTMGAALAVAAIDAGAEVTLIAGPSMTSIPAGVSTVRVITALEMESAVQAAIVQADALIMAAAVADFRPESIAQHKIKKTPGEDRQTLDLVRNPDIIAGVEHTGLIKIGFAAETQNLLRNAASKLESKGLDMIVANDAVATIGAETSQATLIRRGKDGPEVLPAMAKTALATVIIDRLATMLSAGGGA